MVMVLDSNPDPMVMVSDSYPDSMVMVPDLVYAGLVTRLCEGYMFMCELGCYAVVLSGSAY